RGTRATTGRTSSRTASAAGARTLPPPQKGQCATPALALCRPAVAYSFFGVAAFYMDERPILRFPPPHCCPFRPSPATALMTIDIDGRSPYRTSPRRPRPDRHRRPRFEKKFRRFRTFYRFTLLHVYRCAFSLPFFLPVPITQQHY